MLYIVHIAVDGGEALRLLEQPDGPRLAVLDRMMPRLDGLDVCRSIRTTGAEPYIYIILLTAQGQQQEIIEGMYFQGQIAHLSTWNDGVISVVNAVAAARGVKVGMTAKDAARLMFG